MNPRVIMEGNSKGNVELSFCHGRSQDPQVGPGEDSGLPRNRGRTAEAALEDENCMAPGWALTVDDSGYRRLTQTPAQSTCMVLAEQLQAPKGGQMRPYPQTWHLLIKGD